MTNARPPIKVLIVEDSPVAQEFLKYILSSDPAIQVSGVANNGAMALEMLARGKPDVITMDVHMPLMDGFEATRRIMETFPTPIVVVSGSTGATELGGTFRAIEAGALAVVRRPPGMNHDAFEAGSRELIQTVKLMSEIKVVRRIARVPPMSLPASPPETGAPCAGWDIRLVAIGASTGGPPVLRIILAGLPRDFPAPVLIVQHIASGFVQGFAEWLSSSSGFPVGMAKHGEIPAPGRGYLAPDNRHLGVGDGLRIALSDDPPDGSGLRPSVAHLFRSVAHVCGPRAAGILLTGMGRDGAEELKAMKDRGAVTIAQDETSSVVYGMPGEAVKLGAATYTLTPDEMVAALISLVNKPNGKIP